MMPERMLIFNCKAAFKILKVISVFLKWFKNQKKLLTYIQSKLGFKIGFGIFFTFYTYIRHKCFTDVIFSLYRRSFFIRCALKVINTSSKDRTGKVEFVLVDCSQSRPYNIKGFDYTFSITSSQLFSAYN